MCFKNLFKRGELNVTEIYASDLDKTKRNIALFKKINKRGVNG